MEPGARIVNIASRAYLGARNQVDYVASKGGAVSLTRALAMEVIRRGILVNAVAPGLIDTPLLRQMTPDRIEAQLALQPTGKAGRPEDVANAASTKRDGSIVKYPHLVWERAKPGLMAVNGAGRRFVNESTSYHEFGLAMYESHKTAPSIPSFLICDAPFIKRWGLGLALPGGRSFRRLAKAGYLIEAPTLAALAGKLGIEPSAALVESARSFNEGARAGRDPLGKGGDAYNRYLGDPTVTDGHPNLGTIDAGPFYAVKVYPGDIGTAGGFVTDENARVLDADGTAIPGLYAAGNDMNSVMGGTYPGPGITLGPALTFGWLAGKHLALDPGSSAASTDERASPQRGARAEMAALASRSRGTISPRTSWDEVRSELVLRLRAPSKVPAWSRIGTETPLTPSSISPLT